MEAIYRSWFWNRFLRTFAYGSAVLLVIAFVGVSIGANSMNDEVSDYARPLTGTDLVNAIEQRGWLENCPPERVENVLNLAKSIGDKPVVNAMKKESLADR